MNAPSRFPGLRWPGLKVAVLGMVAIAVGLAALTVLLRPPPVLRLPDGTVLELARVDVSSNSICSLETGWRALARRVCPEVFAVAALGAEPVARRRTLHESVMIWIWHRDAAGAPMTAGGWTARTEFPDGTTVAGIPARSGPNLYCLELRSAPRDGPMLPLVVRAADVDLAWAIPMPRRGGRASAATSAVASGESLATPAPASSSAPRTVPQTNRWPETEIVLAGFREGDAVAPRLIVRALRDSLSGEHPETAPMADAAVEARAAVPLDGRVGWVEWRVSVMDEAGNWAVAGWPQRSTRPTLAAWPSPARSWRVMAEGMEYVSAGFVTNPPPGSVQRVLLTATGRAQALGVRWLAVLGEGAYRITSAGARPWPGSAASGQSRTTLESRPAGVDGADASARGGKAGGDDEGWGLELRATGPGVLVVLDPGRGGPTPTVRLRERFPAGDGHSLGDGRVFAGARSTGASVWRGGREWHAEFIAPVLPGSAERLEVEVVAPLPTATFHVLRP